MAKGVSNYQESANKQELNDRVISFLSLIVFNRKRALLHPRRFEIKSRYFRNFSLHHDLILIALESSYAFDKGRVWTHTHTHADTQFRINAEWNFIRMHFSFCARLQVSRKGRISERTRNQENQFIGNTQRVRERFAQISPLLPSGKHSNTSPAFPKFDILFISNLEINCTRYRQSKYRMIGQPANCRKLEGVTRAIK